MIPVFSPEVSRLSAVVTIDVGDDSGEQNDAVSLWVYRGCPGNAKGCFLLGTDCPAVTDRT